MATFISRTDADATIVNGSEMRALAGRVSYVDHDCSLGCLVRALAIRNNPEITAKEIRTRDLFVNIISYSSFANDIFISDDDLETQMHQIKVYGVLPREFDDRIKEVDDYIESCANTIWATSKTDKMLLGIERFLGTWAKTRIYQSTKYEQAIALVRLEDGARFATMEWTRSFMSVLFRVAPWYFPNGLTEQEKKLFAMLAKVDGVIFEEDVETRKAFLKYLNDAVKGFDIRKCRIVSELGDYYQRQRDEQLDTLRTRVTDITESIQHYESLLAEEYKSYDSVNEQLRALQCVESLDSDQLVNFFLQHKDLRVIGTYAGAIQYSVSTLLEDYDERELARIFENKNSWLYTMSYDCPYTLDIVRAIFLEKRAIMRMTATFRLQSLRKVSPIANEYDSTNQSDMPNPHIYYYGCSGGNDQYYSEYAKNGEWDLAIEQSIGATSNWNVYDMSVSNKFIRRIDAYLANETSDKILYVKDGEPMTDIEGAKMMSLVDFKNLIKGEEQI